MGEMTTYLFLRLMTCKVETFMNRSQILYQILSEFNQIIGNKSLIRLNFLNVRNKNWG